MKNITLVNVKGIVLPRIVIAIPSKKNIESLCKILSVDPTNQNHFVTIALIKDELILLSGYDVYLTAKKLNLKTVNAIILENISDPQMAHVIMSHKVHTNPIKIIKVMEDYVKLDGIQKTLEKLHLEPVFGKIFSLGLLPETRKKLDMLCSDAYDDGVNSIIPYALLQYVSKLEPASQPELISKLDELRTQSKSRFRWPHNEYLRNLVKPTPNKIAESKKNTETPISNTFRSFVCTSCGKGYFVDKLRITAKKTQAGMSIMEGDFTQPILEISKKHIKHLGISPDQLPEIILSGTDDTQNMLKKLKNRKFVIYVGPEN